MLAVYEEPQHHQFEEIIQTTRIPSSKTDSLRPLELSPYHLRRSLNDRILLLSLLIAALVKLRHHFLLHRPRPVHEGLPQQLALLACPLDSTIRSLDPAERGGEVGSECEVFAVFDEGDDIGYIFFVANLLVFCILVYRRLVLAGDGLQLDLPLLDGHPHQLELEVAAAAGPQKHHY